MLAWIADYLGQRRADGLKENTMRTLAAKFNVFTLWVKESCGGDLRRVTAKSLHDFLAWVQTAYRIPFGPNRGKTIRPLYAHDICWAVTRLFFWLTDTRRLVINPARHFEIKQAARPLPVGVLSRNDIKHLLSKPDTRTVGGCRDRAVMEVLYGTGLRRTELYGLDVEDVDLPRAVAFIRRGKGMKDRVVPMGRVAADMTARYLSWSRMRLVSSPLQRALFVNDRGKRMCGDWLSRTLRKYARWCGIKRRVHPHGIRHTVATHMLENGADVRTIKELLGHAGLESTQIYTHLAVPHLKKEHTEKHPHGRKHRR